METTDPGPVPEHTPPEVRMSTDELLAEAFRCTAHGLPIAAAGYYTELDRRLRAGERPPVAWVNAS